MVSGECRVDPIGSGRGHRLALDGLRLRLDLRIVPGDLGGGDAAAAAVWRVEDACVATLPLGVPALYRRVAVMAGLGALALALLVWFGTRAPSAVTPVAGPALGVTPPGAALRSGEPSAAGARDPGVVARGGAGAAALASPSTGGSPSSAEAGTALVEGGTPASRVTAGGGGAAGRDAGVGVAPRIAPVRAADPGALPSGAGAVPAGPEAGAAAPATGAAAPATGAAAPATGARAPNAAAPVAAPSGSSSAQSGPAQSGPAQSGLARSGLDTPRPGGAGSVSGDRLELFDDTK